MSNEAKQIITILNNSGFEACAVGGCVRDMLLGKTPADWDIATSATPLQMRGVFSEYTIIPTGEQHGTLTIIVGEKSFEVTTYRLEGDYKDFRHPNKIEYSKLLIEDLSRRDFTINAMALFLDGRIFDPFNGMTDLENRIIKCVGIAKQRFSEDALRIMRCIRFSSQLSFSIDEETVQGMLECKNLLKKVSAERLRDELNKLLCGQNFKQVLLLYKDILEEILPEIAACFGFKQKNVYHIYDVWEHTVVAMEHSPSEVEIRLILLLHDVGKPNCFTVDKNGTGHFYGHAKASSEIARDILTRLRYPGKLIERIVKMISYHDNDIMPTDKSVRRWLNRLNIEDLKLLLEIKKCDNLAQNPKYPFRGEEAQRALEMIKTVEKQNMCFDKRHLCIDGSDLVALGFKGRAIGILLDKMVDAVIEGELYNSKESLTFFAKSQISDKF